MSMTLGRTVQLLEELLGAWNDHDADRVAAFYASGFEGIDVGEAAPQRGPDGVRASFARYLRAFPDLRLHGDEILVDGDRVALFWTARGTHLGVLMSIPATGRQVVVRGASLLTLDPGSGKIVRARYIWDVAGLLRHLGLLPDLS